MQLRTSRLLRLLAALLTLAMIAAACGSSDDGSESTTTSGDSQEEAEAEPNVAEEREGALDNVGGTAETDEEPEEAMEEDPVEEETEAMDEEAAEEPEAMEEEAEEPAPAVAAPEGVLRYSEFSPVTTFDPAGAQTAQSAYLYPVYDTLVRQNAEFQLEPSLATAWSQPDPTTWVFELRDDVVFHDGATFDGEVAAANLNRSKATEGNPNGAAWAGFVEATATGDYEVTATFTAPQPQFLLQMSMVMGMMISPDSFDDDLTRSPSGSGPWIWSPDESEAGVTEVYNLNENYWNPADQGVSVVQVTAVPDNTARLNAILTGDVDIAASIRDAQLEQAIDEGLTVISVPNYFPYMLIAGRDGSIDEPLADVRVRQAMAFAIDRNAYNEAIHAGRGDSLGGVYPTAFSEWHVDSLDNSFEFDQQKSRDLLAEAGYPDGITIQSPIMPAIQPHVELVTQMWAAVGINVEQIQINNGELGPRTRAAEWGVNWFRELLFHPADTFPKYAGVGSVWNPFNLEDNDDLAKLLVEAAESTDPAVSNGIYAEVAEELINRGVIIPLAHGSQNGLHAPGVDGVVMGLNMQAPMPYGVTVN